MLVLHGGQHRAAHAPVGLVAHAVHRHAVGEVVHVGGAHQRLVRVEVALRDAVVAGHEGEHVLPVGRRAAVAPQRGHRGGGHRHRLAVRLQVVAVPVVVYQIRQGALRALGVIGQIVKEGAEPAVECHGVAHRLHAPPLDGVQLAVAARQHLHALAVEGEIGLFQRVERHAGSLAHHGRHGPVKARKVPEDGVIRGRARKGQLVRIAVAHHGGVVQLLARPVEKHGAVLGHVGLLPAYVERHFPSHALTSLSAPGPAPRRGCTPPCACPTCTPSPASSPPARSRGTRDPAPCRRGTPPRCR